MLHSEAIFSAHTLAEQFDATGVVLTPLAGSPLHHLVEACNITSQMAFKQDTGDVTIDFFGIEQTANSKEGAFDRSRHDYAMDDFVSVGAKAVQGALNVSRTVVVPRIQELLDLVTMRLSNAPVSELSRIKITEEEDCPAIYGPNFAKLVDPFVNYPNTTPRLAIDGPELDTASILKMLETGVTSIDELSITWAASLPEYQLQDTYKNFFTIRNGSEDNRDFFGRMEKSVPRMVLVFCMARNLYENDTVLEGVSLSLKEYREVLKEIMAQAGHMLANQMERNDLAIKNGTLVRSVTSYEIRVFPPVYKLWLEQGGDTDALYGMAVSGQPAFTVDAVTEKAADYIESWRRYSSLITSRDSAVKFNYLREQLALSYESILGKPNEAGEVLQAPAINAEMATFRDVLKTVNADDADDLHALCRKLVCRTSFAHTPAELILTKMDEEAKRNPKLTPREAGALAALWYISTWVASLIVPQSV